MAPSATSASMSPSARSVAAHAVSMEDALEAGTQLATAPRGGVGAIRLEIIVEAPDQHAHALLSGAVQIGEGVQLVYQPFRMHPAERVAADVELASVIA